jgi:hypothetical protein
LARPNRLTSCPWVSSPLPGAGEPTSSGNGGTIDPATPGGKGSREGWLEVYDGVGTPFGGFRETRLTRVVLPMVAEPEQRGMPTGDQSGWRWRRGWGQGPS